MDVVKEGLTFAGFRRMFYFVTPSETSFESLEKTPKILDQAMPWFFIFIFLEIAYAIFKKKKNLYKANDTFTSLGAGVIHQTTKILFCSIEFTIACYIYEHYALVHLPWDSPWTWFLAFICVDFAYYWFHRSTHEVNFLWSFHQVHHSSEYYNLSTALRQGMVQQYMFMFFYLPEAFILPPSVHMVHLSLNLIYQFWIHTQLIGNLGPLEYILNTPSHHRVHHGRNRYCIDKNYAATLIIWDRLFGTFQAEKEDEPVAYGLVHNVNTFDQLNLQLYHFKYVWWEKLRSMSTFSDKMKALLYGPGWFPGTPRMGNLSDIPEVMQYTKQNAKRVRIMVVDFQIEKKIQPYDPPVSKLVCFYAFVHFSITNFVYVTFALQREDMTFAEAAGYAGFIILSLQCLGAFFDKKQYAPYLELLRSAVLYYWLFPKIWPPNTLFHGLAHAYFFVSTAFWIVKVMSYKSEHKKGD